MAETYPLSKEDFEQVLDVITDYLVLMNHLSVDAVGPLHLFYHKARRNDVQEFYDRLRDDYGHMWS